LTPPVAVVHDAGGVGTCPQMPVPERLV
jgi:hypothetical protein